MSIKRRPGAKFAIGTEIHLVNRLRRESGPFIIPLDDCGCLCSTMFRIDASAPAVVAGKSVEGRVVNQISVPARCCSEMRASR